MLGTLFDCSLTMIPCLEGILSKIRPKIRAMLRLKHIYSVPAMIGQYKCHIWGLKEYSNGAIIPPPWAPNTLYLNKVLCVSCAPGAFAKKSLGQPCADSFSVDTS